MRQLPCSERRCDKRLFIRLGGGVTGDECIHRSGLSPYLQVLRARTLQPSLKDVNKRGRVVDAGEVRDKSLQRHQIEGKQLTDGRKEDQRPHLRNPSAASWIFSWRGRDQQSILRGSFVKTTPTQVDHGGGALADRGAATALDHDLRCAGFVGCCRPYIVGYQRAGRGLPVALPEAALPPTASRRLRAGVGDRVGRLIARWPSFMHVSVYLEAESPKLVHVFHKTF